MAVKENNGTILWIHENCWYKQNTISLDYEILRYLELLEFYPDFEFYRLLTIGANEISLL